MPSKTRILVVDDEKGVRNLLEAMLQRQGHQPVLAQDAEEALAFLGSQAFELMITDLRLPGLSGEALLEKVKQHQPNLPVVVISGYGNTRNVVQVIQKGAEDYLPKPFTAEDLEVVVLKALKKQRLLAENERLRQEASGRVGRLIGRSRTMTRVHQMIEKFAPSEANVLITGESGVGKDLAARALHELSRRSKGPLIQVNAGALPSSLFEAELFGVKKGAYTGASESREGLFQAAHGGTLFLDEIAEIPMESQAKLLRVLESGEVRSIGDTKSRKVDVRLVAATNQDLDEMVGQKRFRRDLYHRLSVLVLPIPPLRERREDIPLLAQHFLEGFARSGGKPPKLSAVALKWLMVQDWTGNIRELKNTLERAVLMAGSGEIEGSDLSVLAMNESQVPQGPFRLAKRAYLESFEKNYLQDLLRDCSGNVSEAARRAGIARRNFQVLLRKYKLNPSAFKSSR